MSQIESTDELFEVLLDGALLRSERHRREGATRGYMPDQVAWLLERAGFAESYSGFTWQPAQPGDDLYTVVAQRPA